jgi:hypothetical protein
MSRQLVLTVETLERRSRRTSLTVLLPPDALAALLDSATVGLEGLTGDVADRARDAVARLREFTPART